ncbi:hypothetical protein KSP39_PZI009183 [Platanthera zijinensis]|uniref:HAT C-terminal dimerisation domain-containing protein n=1 Tax=Platanthera zijinensis TaxID=2320716 RepID=A0AAP0G7Q8_9ASPA
MDLLEVFYTATNSLSGVYYPTSPLVIENIVNISQKLNYFKQHAGWIELIKIMEIKFLKYYREIPVMFSCAAALNPLFGVDGVENFIEEINNNIGENFDILKWWKSKVNTYPIMAYMARDLLTIQASTVASESAFSLSGRVLNERRSRLSEESLEICICYKDHLDAMKRKQHISAIEDSSSDMEGEMDAINLN